MDGDFEVGSLCRGDTNLEHLPIITLSRRCARNLISHIDRFATTNRSRNGELSVTAFRSFQHLCLNAAQRQCTSILQSDNAILGFTDGDVTGNITIFSTLQAIDIESGLFLSSRIVLEAGTY